MFDLKVLVAKQERRPTEQNQMWAFISKSGFRHEVYPDGATFLLLTSTTDRAFLIFTFRLLRRATGWMSQAAIDRQIRPIYGEQPSVLPLLTHRD